MLDQQHDNSQNENEIGENNSDGSFDNFNDFDNFDDQAWGYDDNDFTSKEENTNFENENSDYTVRVAELVARRNQENSINKSETTLLKQASSNNKPPVKQGGMSLKSKTAAKKSTSSPQQVQDEKLMTNTVNNKPDSFLASTNIEKTNKVGGGLLKSSIDKPKPKSAIKDDLGDEFSIKIKTKPSGGLSAEPDFFADMMPSLNDTSKIAKTVLIERKDDNLSSKFQVTAPGVDLNTVRFLF